MNSSNAKVNPPAGPRSPRRGNTISYQLAEELSKHPILISAVQHALAADDKMRRAAREMANALGINEAEAYGKLLLMKGST